MSGKLIQEKALLISVQLGYDDFSASNGWLESWQKRHGVKFSVLCGECADVPEDVCNDWSKRLPNICEGYELKDIFNCDETGLFYRTSPSNQWYRKGKLVRVEKRLKTE